MKMTQWFEGHVKPVHIGVYPRKFGTPKKYSHWNGEWWGCIFTSPERAFEYRKIKSDFQQLPWKGIKK